MVSTGRSIALSVRARSLARNTAVAAVDTRADERGPGAGHCQVSVEPDSATLERLVTDSKRGSPPLAVGRATRAQHVDSCLITSILPRPPSRTDTTNLNYIETRDLVSQAMADTGAEGNSNDENKKLHSNGDNDSNSDSDDGGGSTKSRSSIMLGEEGGDTEDGGETCDDLNEHGSRHLGDLTGAGTTTFAKDGAPTYVPVDVSSPNYRIITNRNLVVTWTLPSKYPRPPSLSNRPVHLSLITSAPMRTWMLC